MFTPISIQQFFTKQRSKDSVSNGLLELEKITVNTETKLKLHNSYMSLTSLSLASLENEKMAFVNPSLA
jgi:hypothetical protein